MKTYNGPKQLAESYLHFAPGYVDDNLLDEEVRDMFHNRPEGLEYIYDNFAEGDERNNALKRLDRVYPDQRNLRQRWDDYINYGLPHGSDRYPELWNNEFIEIEKQLPFKDQEEHDKWSNKAATWMGEQDWLDLTDEIIKRGGY